MWLGHSSIEKTTISVVAMSPIDVAVLRISWRTERGSRISIRAYIGSVSAHAFRASNFLSFSYDV